MNKKIETLADDLDNQGRSEASAIADVLRDAAENTEHAYDIAGAFVELGQFAQNFLKKPKKIKRPHGTKTPVPKALEIYLDGLDASVDGRGFDATHLKAYETIAGALNGEEARRELAGRIAEFDARCEDAQETDTGEAWELLNEARRLMEAK